MKEIAITEPSFITTFRCTGSECRDHCCKGWTISLDKQAVKKYTSNKHIEIRTIAEQSIHLTKHNKNNWGTIQLRPETGICPYLDDQRLCIIHKKLGSEALSNTCSSFPRTTRIYRTEIANSLNLSCPEAVVKLLTDANAMNLEQRITLQDKFNSHPAYSQKNKLLNLFCMSLVNEAGKDVQTALFAVIKFLLYMGKLTVVDESTLPEIDSFYTALIEQIHSGVMHQEMATFASDGKDKTALIFLMQNYFRKYSSARGSEILKYYIDYMLTALVVDGEDSFMLRVLEIERDGGEIVQKDLSDFEFMFRNLVLYKFWQNDFPNQTERPPLQALYLIIAEYHFMRFIILAYAKAKGGIEINDVINIVYSFHSLSQHDKNVKDEFYKHIETLRAGDDLSMIHLLV